MEAQKPLIENLTRESQMSMTIWILFLFSNATIIHYSPLYALFMELSTVLRKTFLLGVPEEQLQ